MPRTSKPRTLRLVAAAAALGASLSLAGCGFDAQTLQPYTPAQGINVDIKDGPLVRDLVVVSDASGNGRVSASLLSKGKADALSGVEVVAHQSNGLPAAEPTKVTGGGIALPANQLVVLTGSGVTPITVAGPALKPGLTATVKLTFGSGAITSVDVPVVDAASPVYKPATS